MFEFLNDFKPPGSWLDRVGWHSSFRFWPIQLTSAKSTAWLNTSLIFDRLGVTLEHNFDKYIFFEWGKDHKYSSGPPSSTSAWKSGRGRRRCPEFWLRMSSSRSSPSRSTAWCRHLYNKALVSYTYLGYLISEHTHLGPLASPRVLVQLSSSYSDGHPPIVENIPEVKTIL